jgi:hypothetical protein
MPKLMTIYNTTTIVSKVKWSTIKKLERLDPSALVLKDGTNAIFKVATTTGPASLSDFGISFKSQDDRGNAIVSFAEINTDSDVLKDQFGIALLRLSKVEAQIEEKYTDLEAQLNEIFE